jgi:RNA polymerase sigma factor (sigma-70 family)
LGKAKRSFSEGKAMTVASVNTVVGYVRRLAAREVQSDHELLERFAANRDECAFAELVRRHGPMVLAACRRALGHEQDAEDVFQAAFLVLARKAGSIVDGACVGGWLYQVAYRLALRARASGNRRRTRLAALLAMRRQPAVREEPLLDDEVHRLPERYRSAVVLCYLEGRTQAEAARLLTTTSEAINSRLKRARQLLRRRLVRDGLAVSAAHLLAGTARASVPPTLVATTARAALHFLHHESLGVASRAAVLAAGWLRATTAPRAKLLSLLALGVALFTTSLLFAVSPAEDRNPARTPTEHRLRAQTNDAPAPKNKPLRSCILLWMSGGPSQIDTFDPKPDHPNGALFPAIDTSVKGIQISQNLPRLAKQMEHLALFRTITHRSADHNRGTYLMTTGREQDGEDYPSLGSLLAKELEAGRKDLPLYVSIGGARVGSGFLPRKFDALPVGTQVGGFGRPSPKLPLPSVDEFEVLEKGKGETIRKAVAKAFDLDEEKKAVHNRYGGSRFGQGCLLARRLVEAGVPVVEVTLGGWDTHGDALGTIPKPAGELDLAWAALLGDLKDRKLLDTTLIVWMGEFGRTPRINQAGGRDHWCQGFSAVLAGAGIKGGQAIGKTSDDGSKIEERPVTPAEFFATALQALQIDPTRENVTPAGRKLPLVEKGTKAVKEALR